VEKMTENNQVPFLDLKAQFAGIREELLGALLRVVESQDFILGPEVEAFEKELADYIGVRYAVGVASGTDALILTLRSLGLRPGDEVITTPYTFFSTVSAIVLAGGEPVFVDIDPQTFNLDPEKIKDVISERTRAIVAVHLFGQCADMRPVLDIARQRGLFVLEDAAQAMGAVYQGKRAGSIGDAGALSFYPSKTLGAFGDAGMVVTNQEDLFRKIQELRVHGSRYAEDYHALGVNSRLDSIQAAVLRVKLRHLDNWVAARREIARTYDQLFHESAVKTPKVSDRCEHAFYSYVVRVKKRDELVSHLKGKGIGCAVYYPVPLHRMSCFSAFAPEAGLPEAEKAAGECLTLPIYPEMPRLHLERVASVILEFLQGK
jgi:dTDP-4-amino-4,6-dideoxygalactose transaminase